MILCPRSHLSSSSWSGLPPTLPTVSLWSQDLAWPPLSLWVAMPALDKAMACAQCCPAQAAPPTLSQCTLEPLSLAEAAWLQRKLSPVCIFTAWLSGTWHLSLSTGLQKCYWVLARPMLVWPGTCPWSGRTVASELPLLILSSPSTVRQAITEARCQGKELQTCTQTPAVAPWCPCCP